MKRAAALALALWIAPAASAAPGSTDLESAALKTAQTLGGVLRSCPASFAQIGSADKQCVGVGEGVEGVRLKLSAALTADLYGVWRSRDEQRTVYNWLKTANGYVYLRLQDDPDGRAQTLIYLDLPPAQAGAGTKAGSSEGEATATQIGDVTLTPVAGTNTALQTASTAQTSAAQPDGTSPAAQIPDLAAPTPATSNTATPGATAPEPASTATDGAAAPTSAPTPLPFARLLSVQNRRLNGPDVLAVQNRLIALMRPARAGQGDGWYGPVTAQTVRVFQQASGLPVTGVVDRVTWERLFSASAGGFDAP